MGSGPAIGLSGAGRDGVEEDTMWPVLDEDENSLPETPG
jgi:hypothetical protein